MEISLPPYKAFVDGIVDGPITVLRMPKGTVKNGDTVTAKVSGVYPEAVKSGSGTLNIRCCMASRSRKPNGKATPRRISAPQKPSAEA
jgi:hypothetical protein